MSATASWEMEIMKRLKKLDILQQENVQLKNKVADIIKNDVDQTVLERMEYFMSSFINKDAVFALLRYDIADQMKKAGEKDLTSSEQSGRKQCKLCQDIDKMEQEFNKLKIDFDSYITTFCAA